MAIIVIGLWAGLASLSPGMCRALTPAVLARSPARTLMLATTTSFDATGLLNVIADPFKKDTGITLRWIAVGTGAALKQARDGNADVVIVHAKKLEDEFLRDGFGVNRRVIARNFFVIVGPAEDPARVAGCVSAATALARIKASGAPFVSRGDNSGTHSRELELWTLAGGGPQTAYLETGQGMAETLRVAAERRGYTLSDTATFHGLRGLAGLKPLYESGPELENIYAVIAVNPARVPTARGHVTFIIDPGAIRLSRADAEVPPNPKPNRYRGNITRMETTGDATALVWVAGDLNLRVALPLSAVQAQGLSLSGEVVLEFDPENVKVTQSIPEAG